MKPEFKLVDNINEQTGENLGKILRGKAMLKHCQPLGNLKNSNGKGYTLASIEFEVQGKLQSHSAQVFEKVIPLIKDGTPVSITARVANGNTYFSIIGNASEGVADASLFATLSKGLAVEQPVEEEVEVEN